MSALKEQLVYYIQLNIEPQGYYSTQLNRKADLAKSQLSWALVFNHEHIWGEGYKRHFCILYQC